MKTIADFHHRAEQVERAREGQAATARFPTKSVLCALILTVLLIRGAAAMQLYMMVPIVALNFIAIVIWAQFYRR